MSQETAPADETEETGTSVLELWRTWYDMVGLAVVMMFMLWTRLQSRARFVTEDRVLFSGNDAFYHFREISYIVNNWPFTMPYDVWTGYPYGASAGQFGTLYDQLIATAALIVGLGDPSTRQVALVTLVAPAVFGALVALPVYYMVRRFHGRGTGLFAALLLAFMPGTFFRRSVVGFADHHVAETLFMGTAVLATMVALGVAEREKPVYEQLLDRDWQGLRRPVGYSALAGVATGLYVWVWPPGVVLLGILGVFYTVVLVADFYRGRSPEHVAQVGVVSMPVVALMSLLRIGDFSFAVTDFSLLQPAIAFGLAVWCVLLAGVARFWRTSDVSDASYPLAVGGSLVVGVVLVAVLLPGLFGTIRNSALSAFGFGQSDTVLTIAEAQAAPGVSGGFDLGSLNRFLFAQYGLAFVVALIGLVWMAVRTAYTEYRAEYVLLVVWSVFLWLMALTQTRFNYYLVLSVVVLNGWVFGYVAGATDLDELSGRIGDIKTYQILTVVAVFMLLFAPLVPPLAATGAAATGNPAFVVDAGDRFGPGSVTAWDGPGEWMSENTPEVGNYGDAENADQIPYYGTFGRTDDFEYPDGAYGVMSWWDYGHWITVLAERPPHANPFQQNAESASSFLQASSEERANAVLDALSGTDNVGRLDELSTEQIQANASEGDGEGVRYVMIDDQTAGRKFAAVTQWSVPFDNRQLLTTRDRAPSRENNQGLYFTSERYTVNGQNETLPTVSDRYRETMLAKLYLDDARSLEHYRLVHESDEYSIVGGIVQSNGRVTPTGSTRIGEWSQQRANLSRQLQFANRQNQAIPAGGGAFYDASLEASVKTFERVPGATLSGQVTNAGNVSVFATVRMQTDSGRQFTYVQRAVADEDGSFEMTVPYATDNTVGPAEGGTNTSVTAVGNYSIRVPSLRLLQSQVAVPETAVYDGATIDVGTVSDPVGNQSGGGGGDGQSGDGSSDGSGDGQSGNESGALAPPSPDASVPALVAPGAADGGPAGVLVGAEPR